MELSYVVRCELPDAETAEEWIAWMRSEHLADVCAAGAVSAYLVRIDGASHIFESRYSFASREAFDLYERDHAPRLRAAGLKLFGEDRGINYRRTTGDVLIRKP